MATYNVMNDMEIKGLEGGVKGFKASPVLQYLIMSVSLSTDNATVADLVGLTFWKYIESTKDPVELVSGG